MSEIIPAILPKDKDDLNKKVSSLPEEIKLIHLDVLEEDIWTPIYREFEVHLMIKEPENIIGRWIERGAKRIITHKYIDLGGKIESGLAIEMGKFLVEELPDMVHADFIHLMSIDEIGEQGHPFDPKVFDRIKEVKDKFPNVKISVDGGINTTNYQALIDLGVDRLVVGSGFKNLWSLLKK